MSSDGRSPRDRRPRRQFHDEFKAQAVRLVLDEGRVRRRRSPASWISTGRRSANWVEHARADRSEVARRASRPAEREELARLRRENRVLQEEREILKKAAAFFAKHQR